jgi:sodium transport system permease protein
MNPIKVIFRKEVLDGLRDYRSWATGLFWALFGPLLMGGMLIMIGSIVREDVEEPVDLPVQGAEHAPNLIRFLEQHDVVIQPALADPEAAVKGGDVNVVLVIPPAYAEEFSSGETATVELVMDSSRQAAQVDVSRIERLLEGYNRYLGTLRLVVRGVSPAVTEVIHIQERDVATPQSRATLFISFLPYFIIFAIFNGAAPIITDTTAGERERRSLEPLLINPVLRRDVVLGKLLAAFPYSTASLAITLIGFGVVFNVMPVEQYLGIRLGLNVFTLFWIFILCLPVIFLACSIQMMVASYVRSTKEASTYLPFIALVPSLPGLALAFFPVKPELWTMLIPTFGQQLLINQLMRLEPVSVADGVISTVVTILISFGFTLVAIWLYNRERIVVGKS